MNFELNNISYKYAQAKDTILNDINCTIVKGEITAIVGPSGCGKSTLVNILSGVIPKMITTGDLRGELKIDDSANIAVVSQSPENQLFGYGVEDAIVFGVENMGLPDDDISENLEFVINLFNIQHLRKRSISTLSGGQRQAVCIASVLAMRPDIIIMDEPVSSLDPDGKKMIQSILKQLNAAGQTTIIVDNNMNWFSDIVDHVIGIDKGSVVFDGDKDEFFRNFDMQIKLGVTIPQEVELYRRLSKSIDGINMFYDIDGAIKEISRFIDIRNNPIKIENKEYQGEEIVKVSSLTKTFNDGFHALTDVNAKFDKGRIISIIGQNGSGKTTLVKHLNRLLSPTSGSVSYMGNDIKDKSVAQISKDIILVFQHPEHMLFEETVERELTFCARAQGIEYTQEEVEEILEKYSLIDENDSLPVNLPMGKKHILTILSVLFSSAKVIILDEPTLGMDLQQKQWLEDIIDTLIKNGKTVIMISHEMPLVFKLSDDIIILDDGRKIFEGTKTRLIDSDEIIETINISLPPIILLAKHFGLPEDIVTVEEFDKVIKSILEVE